MTDLTPLTKMPVHESTDEVLKRVEKKIEAEKEKKAADPRCEEKYTFNFEFKEPNGNSWTGKFTNRALSIAEMQMVGALQAEFAGGRSYDSLDPLTQELNMICAWMAISLEDKPKWAEDLRSLKSIALVQKLYGEVALHEATFHGVGKAKS